MEELFQMAAGEQCQHEPYQWIILIGPEQREDHPVHDNIADQGQEDEHDSAQRRMTQPAHGSAFLESKPLKVFSMALVYDRTIAIAIKQPHHDRASVMGRLP
jgi:hypothetical protein